MVAALAGLAHEVRAHCALELLEDVLHLAKVCDAGLGQVKVRATPFRPTVCLIALVVLCQLLSCALLTAKLAAVLVLRALIEEVSGHIFLKDILLSANLALTTLAPMLLELVVVSDLLAAPGSVAAKELHSSDQTKQVLVVCKSLHLGVLLPTIWARLVGPVPVPDARSTEDWGLAGPAVLRLFAQ